MEYSRNIPWNIPYSKIFDILIVLQFFRNIPRIFHIPPNSIFFLFPFYLEYSIFQKLKNHLVEAKFWNIPYSIKCHQKILKKKKRRTAHGPLGDFFIVSFKNSVSFYFVKKIRKLPSILYDNCL